MVKTPALPTATHVSASPEPAQQLLLLDLTVPTAPSSPRPSATPPSPPPPVMLPPGLPLPRLGPPGIPVCHCCVALPLPLSACLLLRLLLPMRLHRRLP